MFVGNRIGVEGVNAFKLAIQYQDTILNESPKSQGTGLMRLVINVSLVTTCIGGRSPTSSLYLVDN